MNTNKNDITALARKLRQTVSTLNGMIEEIERYGKLQEGTKLPISDRRLLDLIRYAYKNDGSLVEEVDYEQTENMVLIATDHHVQFGRPIESWVREYEAIQILSPTYHPADGSLEALKLALYRTKAGEQSKWYIKAGPVTLAELNEWCDIDAPNKGSLPPSIQSRPPSEVV